MTRKGDQGSLEEEKWNFGPINQDISGQAGSSRADKGTNAMERRGRRAGEAGDTDAPSKGD